MNNEARQLRNKEMLAQCNPWFQHKVEAVIKDLESHGVRPRIQCAWRSPAEQLAAFKSGHSKLRFGFHNVTTVDGHANAMAVDILDDDNPLSPSNKYLLMLASSSMAHGLTSGICWGLPARLRNCICAAIRSKNWAAPIKVGWDPCHVEPVGVTPKQAQAGQLPKD